MIFRQLRDCTIHVRYGPAIFASYSLVPLQSSGNRVAKDCHKFSELSTKLDQPVLHGLRCEFH